MHAVVVTAFATGFGLGFLVAAQVGPISLLCVRSMLHLIGTAAGPVMIAPGAGIRDEWLRCRLFLVSGGGRGAGEGEPELVQVLGR